jgi:hypothetical protein
MKNRFYNETYFNLKIVHIDIQSLANESTRDERKRYLILFYLFYHVILLSCYISKNAVSISLLSILSFIMSRLVEMNLFARRRKIYNCNLSFYCQIFI